MASDRPVRRLDAAGLRALAHPLLVRMLGSLRNDGPATATQLAARLGESTGTTSWHLRRLADAGFIEEDPDRGTKRDRWWRSRNQTTEMRVRDFADRPELVDTVDLFLHSVLEEQFRRAIAYLDAAQQWLPSWQDAATFSDYRLRMDPARLHALTADLTAVVERYQAEDPAPGAEAVVVQIQAFHDAGAS